MSHIKLRAREILGLSGNPIFHREHLTKRFDTNKNTGDAMSFSGLENFVNAVDYHFQLNLPATFSQPGKDFWRCLCDSFTFRFGKPSFIT